MGWIPGRTKPLIGRRAEVMAALRFLGRAYDRPMIAEALGLGDSAVSNYIREFVERGLVRRHGERLSGWYEILVDDLLLQGGLPLAECARIEGRLRDLIEARAGPVTTLRPCLVCEKVFPSEGKHNRLCENCRTQSSGDWFARYA